MREKREIRMLQRGRLHRPGEQANKAAHIRASGMARQVMAPAAKSDDLSSVSGTHKIKGKILASCCLHHRIETG